MKVIRNWKQKLIGLRLFVSCFKFERGQMLIIAIVFLAVVLILSASMFANVANFLKFGSNSILREQATHLAEAGVDYAIWQLNESAGSDTSAKTNFPVGTTGTFSFTITEKTAFLKTITSTGYVPNTINPKAKRTIKVDALIDSQQISFRYAVQSGTGGVDMANSATINGTVYSNGNITGSGSSTINGDAYAVGTISSPDPTVTGNKVAPASPAPMPTENPQQFYQNWKDLATAGGIIDCNITPAECDIKSVSMDLVTKKYIGDLSISANAIVTVKGPIYVTGNLSVSQGGTEVRLDESFGSNGTVIIVDGTISISQGATFKPTSANPKGYILVVTTSTSLNAVSLSNRGVNAILYALDGGADLFQQAQVSALVAKNLNMQNSAVLDYDQGLAGAQFSEGPGGTWVVKKGTYRFTKSP